VKNRKICLKCKRFLNRKNFHKHKCRKDGLADWCKECRQSLSEKTIRRAKLFQQNKKICSNCKEIKKLHNFYVCKNKYSSHCKECKKLFYLKNLTRELQTSRKYYEKHKEYYTNYNRKYYRDHLTQRTKYHKEYRQNHKTQIAIRQKRNRQKNLRFKIRGNLATRMYQAIKNNIKSLSTMFLIGCEIDYLMYHLQKQFKKNMNWDNYGKWHIDHIKPCASFDLTKESEQRKCFHYTNLQPLWAKINQQKNDSEVFNYGK